MIKQAKVLIVFTLLLAMFSTSGSSAAPLADTPGPQTPLASYNNTFSYQGSLKSDGGPATGIYDFQFKLYDTATVGTGTLLGTVSANDVAVTAGLFTVELNFTAANAFDGNERWLQIELRLDGVTSYTTLSPRQKLNPTPYALFSLNADKLDGQDGSYYRSATNINAGTLGAGYYSAYADLSAEGYLGNASGDIALNNSNLQTNLNADRLDGLEADSFVSTSGDSMSGSLTVSVVSSARNIKLGGGPTIAFASLRDKWNLPSSNGLGAVMATITGGPDNTVGLGLIQGDNVTSPVVWMYSSDGRNAFTVAAKGYTGSGDMTDIDSYLTPLFQVRENGRVGIGTVNPQQKLDVNGTTRTKILQIMGGADLAEPFSILGAEQVTPGMLVVIDPEHAGQLRIADQAYDRKVVGCISGAGGVNPGLVMQQENTPASGSVPVALSGRVYCWADASYGPIQPGDMLTSSNTPGHVMLVSDYAQAQGSIIGKAMSALEQGVGLILVLVTLQ